MIHQISDRALDVREIACIGERVNVNGYTCGFDVWLKGGAKIFIPIVAECKEEKSTYDGPVTSKLMERADKERNELIILWRQNTAQ